MKKITFALLLCLGLNPRLHCQITTTLAAPPYDGGYSSASAPSGSADAVYHRACFLITAAEMQGIVLTTSVISKIGYQFVQGVNTAVTGNYTIYLQNTLDASYSKGATWSSILTGMQLVYNSTFPLPVTTGAQTVMLSLSPSFNWTGNGLYVACDWYAPSANSTQAAFYACNYQGLSNSLVRNWVNSIGPAPTSLSLTSNFRPSLLFTAQNTATNDIAVVSAQPYGQLSKLGNNSQAVTAVIRNASNISKSTVSVGLVVTGANSFADMQVVPTIGAGSLLPVTFNSFTATANGADNFSVFVLPDQNNANNSTTMTQSISCNYIGVSPAMTSGNYTSSCYGAGAAGAIVAFNYTSGTAPSSVISVGCVAPSFSNAGNAGNSLSAVLCDASGNVLATGNPVILTSSNMDVYAEFKFSTPVSLTPNTPYFLGLTESTGTCFPFGNTSAPIPVVLGNYRIPAGGGTPVQTNFGYLSLFANLTFTNTAITSAAPTNTRMCNSTKYTTTNTITVNGPSGMTFVYTASSGQNISSTASTAVVSPSVAGAGNGIVSYSIVGTDPTSGCKSVPAVVSISVQACTGIADNGTFGSTLKMFPNPAVNNKINITGLDGNCVIAVYNITGQEVLATKNDSENTVLDLQNLPQGNYLVRISNDAGQYRNFNIAK